MTYELAKKLEKAGFNRKPFDYQEYQANASFPTLSELIEACGDKFRKLILHSENKKHPGLIWQAGANQHKAKGIVSTRASTPEEAVANLWLKLNNK